MIRSDRPTAQIATTLRRSVSAVRQKAWSLGLELPGRKRRKLAAKRRKAASRRAA
jgi:hypothetical protein